MNEHFGLTHNGRGFHYWLAWFSFCKFAFFSTPYEPNHSLGIAPCISTSVCIWWDIGVILGSLFWQHHQLHKMFWTSQRFSCSLLIKNANLGLLGHNLPIAFAQTFKRAYPIPVVKNIHNVMASLLAISKILPRWDKMSQTVNSQIKFLLEDNYDCLGGF